MSANGKGQVKLFLSPGCHDALKQYKALTGVSMSQAVEALVMEVLKPEMGEIKKGVAKPAAPE